MKVIVYFLHVDTQTSGGSSQAYPKYPKYQKLLIYSIYIYIKMSIHEMVKFKR